MKRTNKVFVGPGNIAGFAKSTADSLKKVGIDSKSFSYNKHPFGYPCDVDGVLIHLFPKPENRTFIQKCFYNRYTIKPIYFFQRIALFVRACLRYNTFIFISNETFFDNNRDLMILKFLKKQIAILFVGCPERDPNDVINKKDGGICLFCTDRSMQDYLNCFKGDKKENKIKYISNYADYIFSHRDTATYIKDKSIIKKFFCITERHVTKEYIVNKFKGIVEFNISHLPSNSLLKGTAFVEKAISELKTKGYKFNYYSSRVSHSQVSNILKKTHILIDQFGSAHGLLSVEAMAHGCIVICKTAEWFREDFPELPLIGCEPEEITDVIIDLMNNPQKMLEIALESFEYYQKHHTPEVVGNYFKNIMDLN